MILIHNSTVLELKNKTKIKRDSDKNKQDIQVVETKIKEAVV